MNKRLSFQWDPGVDDAPDGGTALVVHQLHCGVDALRSWGQAIATGRARGEDTARLVDHLMDAVGDLESLGRELSRDLAPATVLGEADVIEVAREAASLAEVPGVSVVVLDAHARVPLRTAGGLLQRALGVLLGVAVRHARGPVVELLVEPVRFGGGKGVKIEIADESPRGPMSPAERRDRAITLDFVRKLVEPIDGRCVEAGTQRSPGRTQLLLPAEPRPWPRTRVDAGRMSRPHDRAVVVPAVPRVLVACESEWLVEGLRIALRAELTFEYAGVATSPGQTLRMLTEASPSVLLLDEGTAGDEAATFLAECRAAAPDVRIIVLVADVSPLTLGVLVGAGANEVVPKSASVADVAAAIRSSGSSPGAALRAGAGGWTRPGADRPGSGDPAIDLMIATLSSREREVLRLMARGYSNPVIATELELSVNTVRKHVEHVLVKLGVHSKLEAAAFAARHGLVPATGGGTRPF